MGSRVERYQGDVIGNLRGEGCELRGEYRHAIVQCGHTLFEKDVLQSFLLLECAVTSVGGADV